MRKHPKKLDFETLMLIAQGHAAFQLLWAATELDLFDHLSGKPGSTLPEIASTLGLEVQPTRILLTGLTTLGIIEPQATGYCNAELTEAHLVKKSPDSMVPILGWQAHIVYPGLLDFLSSLKENRNVGLDRFAGDEPTLYQRLARNPTLERVFQEAMSSLSAQANEALSEILDLSNTQHIMDVGGGVGTNLIKLATRFPHLRATVFDSPTICQMATANIAKHGLSERIDTCAGNLFDTPYPDGLDAIMYCHMFTIYSPEKNQFILHKTADALPRGGKVIIFNMMGNDEDDGPMSTALGSPYFQAIATGEGMLYSWQDYQNWFDAAGFSHFERTEDLPLDHGVFIATK